MTEGNKARNPERRKGTTEIGSVFPKAAVLNTQGRPFTPRFFSIPPLGGFGLLLYRGASLSFLDPRMGTAFRGSERSKVFP